MAQGLSHFPYRERIREFFLIRKSLCWERSRFPGPGAKSMGTKAKGAGNGMRYPRAGGNFIQGMHPKALRHLDTLPAWKAPFSPHFHLKEAVTSQQILWERL